MKWSITYLIDSVLRGVTIAFVVFFLLVIFDSFRFKNRETKIGFFIPKVFIAFILGTLIIFEGMLRVILNFCDTKTVDELRPLLQLFGKLISPIFGVTLLYIFVVIILAFMEVDSIEKYKLHLYILTFSISLLAGLVGYQFHYNNALIFTIQHSIISLFSILMAYFHWPYEIKKDQIYDEQNQIVSNHKTISTFIRNENSDT